MGAQHWHTLAKVSIHAPARGSTTLIQRETKHDYCFYPCPCARGDADGLLGSANHHCFEWPRSCPKCDDILQCALENSQAIVPIHAPLREGLPSNPASREALRVFSIRQALRDGRRQYAQLLQK